MRLQGACGRVWGAVPLTLLWKRIHLHAHASPAFPAPSIALQAKAVTIRHAQL